VTSGVTPLRHLPSQYLRRTSSFRDTVCISKLFVQILSDESLTSGKMAR
jgi:hypothetical protein